jgi:hypothetical protein
VEWNYKAREGERFDDKRKAGGEPFEAPFETQGKLKARRYKARKPKSRQDAGATK